MKEQTIAANGLDFVYRTIGEGELIVCLHGFPDSAHTWDAIAPRLAQQGYKVVAPFLRGYGTTAIPQDADYRPVTLGQDVLALIKALGHESAIVIGHDWGALAAYTAANLDPKMVSKLVTVAIPHPRSLKPSLSGLWNARHFLTFQLRGLARRKLSSPAGIDEIYKRWSPTWSPPASETAYIKQSFQNRARVDAALGYYWSFASTFRDKDAKAQQRTVNAKTDVPTLCLVGRDDGALDLSQMEATRRCFTAPYRFEIIDGVGHFPHREAEDEVFGHIEAFLSE